MSKLAMTIHTSHTKDLQSLSYLTTWETFKQNLFWGTEFKVRLPRSKFAFLCGGLCLGSKSNLQKTKKKKERALKRKWKLIFQTTRNTTYVLSTRRYLEKPKSWSEKWIHQNESSERAENTKFHSFREQFDIHVAKSWLSNLFFNPSCFEGCAAVHVWNEPTLTDKRGKSESGFRTKSFSFSNWRDDRFISLCRRP